MNKLALTRFNISTRCCATMLQYACSVATSCLQQISKLKLSWLLTFL